MYVIALDRDCHCALIGYQAHKKPRATVALQDSSHSAQPRNTKPVVLNHGSIAVGSTKASNPSHSLVGRAEQLIPNSQGTTKPGKIAC